MSASAEVEAELAASDAEGELVQVHEVHEHDASGGAPTPPPTDLAGGWQTPVTRSMVREGEGGLFSNDVRDDDRREELLQDLHAKDYLSPRQQKEPLKNQHDRCRRELISELIPAEFRDYNSSQGSWWEPPSGGSASSRSSDRRPPRGAHGVKLSCSSWSRMYDPVSMPVEIAYRCMKSWLRANGRALQESGIDGKGRLWLAMQAVGREAARNAFHTAGYA